MESLNQSTYHLSFIMVNFGNDVEPQVIDGMTVTPIGDQKVLFEREVDCLNITDALRKAAKMVAVLRLTRGFMFPEDMDIEQVSLTYRPARVKQAS